MDERPKYMEDLRAVSEEKENRLRVVLVLQFWVEACHPIPRLTEYPGDKQKRILQTSPRLGECLYWVFLIADSMCSVIGLVQSITSIHLYVHRQRLTLAQRLVEMHFGRPCQDGQKWETALSPSLNFQWVSTCACVYVFVDGIGMASIFCSSLCVFFHKQWKTEKAFPSLDESSYWLWMFIVKKMNLQVSWSLSSWVCM